MSEPVFQMSSSRNTKPAANLVATDFSKQTLLRLKYRGERFGNHVYHWAQQGECNCGFLWARQLLGWATPGLDFTFPSDLHWARCSQRVPSSPLDFLSFLSYIYRYGSLTHFILNILF